MKKILLFFATLIVLSALCVISVFANTVSSDITVEENGNEIDYTIGIESLYQYVAKIGDVGYETIDGAFEAAKTSKVCTIELLADCTALENQLDVGDFEVTGVDITLNLNGKTITVSGNGVLVFEGNSLTINNNDSTGGGICNNNLYGYAIVNYGTLVVNGGNFVGDNALRNGSYSTTAKATLNGGTFSVNNNDAFYSVANCSTLTITGATVNNWLATSGVFEMTGGYVENMVANEPDKTVATGTATSVTGGKISALYTTATNPVSIGAEVTVESNDAVAKIDSTYYSTLQSAVKAAQTGETVVLLDDVTLTEDIDLNCVNLDLGGKTLFLQSRGNEILGNVTIQNGTIDISGAPSVPSSGAKNSYFTVGGHWNSEATLTLNGINLVGTNYTTTWAVICVHNGRTLNMNSCTVNLSGEQGSSGGFIKDTSGVNNTAIVNINDSEITLDNASRGFTGAKVTLNDVELTITGGEHGINGSELTAVDSTISISNGTGRGITLNGFNTTIQNTAVTINNMGEGGIRFKTPNALTFDETSTLNETTMYTDEIGATINNIPVTGTGTSKMVAASFTNGEADVEYRLEAAFTCSGYSVNEITWDSITVGYTVNWTIIDYYEKNYGKVDFGGAFGVNSIKQELCTSYSKYTDYKTFNVKIIGINKNNTNHLNANLLMALYIDVGEADRQYIVSSTDGVAFVAESGITSVQFGTYYNPTTSDTE